jgi:hypothetical protein
VPFLGTHTSGGLLLYEIMSGSQARLDCTPGGVRTERRWHEIKARTNF